MLGLTCIVMWWLLWSLTMCAVYAPPASGGPSAAAAATVKALTLQCVDRPGHSGAIAGLRLKHRAYAGTVRLVLRWLACQMFGDHVSVEAVELLVAVRQEGRWDRRRA